MKRQRARTGSVLVMVGAVLWLCGAGCGRDPLNYAGGGGRDGHVDGGGDARDGGGGFGGFKLPLDAGLDAAALMVCGMCATTGQTCCLSLGGQATCQPSSQPCSGGSASISCISPSGCKKSQNQICCLDLIGLAGTQGPSASCTSPGACSPYPARSVVCGSERDCPSQAPHCCTVAGLLAFCQSTACSGIPGLPSSGTLP